MADKKNSICGNPENADNRDNIDTASLKNDPVNHPSHYTSGNIEVIDFIEDQKLNMHLGNAVKYISRAGKKDKAKTVEDLKKAVWYIERYIGLLQKAENKESGNTANTGDISGSSVSETFINTEIFIDFSSELLYGEDQAYICYPVKFPTVRFQLMPTKGLIEIIDRKRYKLGYKPMYPVDESGNCGSYNRSIRKGGGTEGGNEALDNDGWYDFFISLNGYTETHLDTCIAAVVAGSDSVDNEEMYTIDLSEAEQGLLYDRFDEQCRKYVGRSCEELLKEAKELMEE